MITTYSSNLPEEQKAAYDELFARMQEYSGKPVNDIHSYLYALDGLMKEMSTKLNANTYNLLRLPLTEPVFEINPDTREITVPKQFKENGLTIQGDKLAEIVWFKMPRFFDLTDFYNFKNDGTKTNSDFEDYHTYIEWYNPSAKLDEHVRGVDLAYAMTCDEEYIYFGWPLADKVSGEAGTIQFTVRFLGVNEGEIKFNFSTRIQSCVIKTTLNFNLLSGQFKADSWEDLIYSRPVYSGVVNSIESPAPIILEGLVDGYQDLEPYTVHYEAEGEPGTTGYKEAHDEIEYKLALNVKAAAPNSANDTQELVFVWYHQVDAMTGLGQVPASVAETAIETSALSGDDAMGYHTAAQSTYTVNKVGRYTVQIGNTLSSGGAGEDKRTRYVYTGVVEVPAPTVPILDNSGIVTRGYTDTVYRNQYSGEVLYNETILTTSISNAVEGDTPHYQWKRRYVKSKENGQFVYETVNVPAEKGGNTNSINPDQEGNYWVEVYTSRNKADSKVVESSIADIRKPPQSFGGLTGSLTLTYNDANHIFVANLNQENIAHKVKYIWYYSPLEGRTGSDNIPSFTQLQVGGSNGVKLNNNTYEVSKAGYYYAEAYEVVFDTEDDPTNAPYTTEAIFSQRAVSNPMTITDQLTLYVESANPENTEPQG